jgi:hypothetical protein
MDVTVERDTSKLLKRIAKKILVLAVLLAFS